MGDLTRNISRYEMACRCGCNFDTIDYQLITLLQEGADYFALTLGKIVIDIRGGNRCVEHNEFVQKKYVPNYVPYSSKSTHMEAKGADFKYWCYVNGEKIQIEPVEVYNYFDSKYPGQFGLGLYHNRCHIDSRNEKARWRA